MAFFFFLPSIMLSGFMFPFRGMPALGAVPSARSCRSPISCGSSAASCSKATASPEVWPQLWPIALFAAVALTIGVKRYRRTLD